MVVVEQMDLHLSHQVSPLMVVLAVALLGGQNEPVLGVGQQTQELMMSLFDFLCEVFPLWLVPGI